MKCPICELEELEHIIFKVTGQKGLLCEDCGRVWFEGEKIEIGSGHAIDGFGERLEYTLEKSHEKDYDSENIEYSLYK